MNISESLALVFSVGVYAKYFNKTDATNILIQKNLLSSIVNISGGINKIGYTYPYNFDFSIYGDRLTLDNLTTYNGDVLYTTSITKGSSYINTDFSTKQSNIYYDKLYEQILGYSNYLGSLSQTGTKRYTTSDTTYSFYTSGVTVINLQDSDMANFNSATILSFKGSYSDILILNISSSSSININNKTFEFSGIAQNNIIFNILSNIVNIVGDIKCIIFAPNSTINISNSSVYGQVISNTINISNSSIYSYEFNELNSLPIATLNTLTIDANPNNSDIAEFTITSTDSPDTIYYSLNGGEYFTYINSVILTFVDTYIINAYSTKYGYYDSSIVSETISITCVCEDPVITYDSVNKTISFSSDHGGLAYFTLDGSNPTKDSANIKIGDVYNLEHDGEYNIVAYASNGICADSGISSKTVYVEFDEPIVTIDLSPNTVDSQGSYFDYSGNGVLVTLSSNYQNATILYTIDNRNPMTYGLTYTGPFYIKTGKVKAIAFGSRIGYSDVFISPTIVLSANAFIEKSNTLNNLELKNQQYEPAAQFGEDMSWTGPLVLADDNAVYQALVNILSTSLLEIPFRYDFGTSLQSIIFNISSDLSSTTIITNLKNEIEYNDPRINIDTKKSYAYYQDSDNALIIFLEWTNKITGNKATIKYDYSLDGIL